MSKIADEVRKLESQNYQVSSDTIVENYPIRDIKEYISYLRKELKDKDTRITELIVENTKLEVKAENK